MKVEKAKMFHLPDGSYIRVETSESDAKHWRASDLHLILPDGRDILFCGIEYEDRLGLRVLLFDEEHEEPVHEQIVLKPEDVL